MKKQELLNLVTDASVKVPDARGACFCLMDVEKNRLIPAVQRELSENHIAAEPDRAEAVLDELQERGCRAVSDIIDDDCVYHVQRPCLPGRTCD